MEFKQLVSMNIAIIGDTDAAVMHAIAFANAGHIIYMAGCEKNGLKHLHMPAHSGDIRYCTISDAASVADLIIIGTLPKEVREAAYWLGDVRRKVIIDITANVHTQEDELVKTVCAIKAITGSPHVIKVFNTRGYEQLLKPLFNGVQVDLMLLSDSKKAKEITKIMAVELGLTAFYDFGGSEAIPLFNEMTKSWRRLKLELSRIIVPATITDTHR
jgi:8-hydroxy-5-deazaflavin:NADPH oxidoreductase